MSLKLKCKYFQKGNVPKEKLGYEASFLYKSIHAVVEMIEKGIIWWVGNGQSIKIWGDRWLPSPSTHTVHSPVNTLDKETVASALTDECSKEWNQFHINQNFTPAKAEKFYRIPLSRHGAVYNLIWRPTKDGKFSVRSAYMLEMDRNRSNRGESSNRNSEAQI